LTSTERPRNGRCGLADHQEGVNALEETEALTAKCNRELQQLQTTLDSSVFPGGLIGCSSEMRVVHQLIEKTDYDFPVLILGETGTGKELVARCVHFSGSRKNRPFVPIDCSAITTSLFESELFGYVRGAFTGASSDRSGLFQAADTGTLFLDEIGELPKELQAKLLRTIQEREVRRVGSTETLPVDIRVIAATNRDLKQAVQTGAFREDLYYRLNVFEIALPTLRQRRQDIPLLVVSFMSKWADPHRPITGIGNDFWDAALGYEWPGNVRELESFVTRCIALGSGPILHDENRCKLLWRTGVGIERRCAEPLAALERRTILKAMSETAGDKRAAARILGIGKTTLRRKLKEYGFEAPLKLVSADIVSTPRETARIIPNAPAKTIETVIESAKHADTLPLDAIEKTAILTAMEETENDRQLVAKKLGIGRTTLYRRLKEYGIPRALRPRSKATTG
jgi:transcriptional regulator with PAS, ATPase and Fis domain